MHRSMLALVAVTLALAACAAPSARTDAPDPTTPESPPATAAGDPTESPDAPAERVTMDVDGYTPATLTVAAGTTVVFVNEDTAVHSVSEGSNGVIADPAFVDADVEPGAELEVIFEESGAFPITCRYHPFMNLTVTVEG